ncbi:putative capsular polysaccharide synthesis family protein [Gracilibacillus salinarum]|uniref:Capsular polysaccharide synthesis family protein n=1 Tax=Gracilibacillus salinarum TaxID=2932255 RepID=A0ABY4GRJ1_9BACI|nr:putative capsular polysaccharide synthesis family protein [Gracilibacillus salinarum]UOQ87008.1 putative capsular polysaccharide synthesis family protein [Gracilibacillus salinarum]
MKKFSDFKNLILIYQMGKVGSTSIADSIIENGGQAEHIHSFHHPVMFEQFHDLKSIDYYFPTKSIMKYKVYNNVFFKNALLRTNKRLKIITLAREPISRNIAMYFQGIHFPIFEINRSYNNRSDEDVNFELIIQLFLNKFHHNYGIKWFDNEFNRTFSVDIYDYPFDKEKGYTIINTRNLDIMVIKMEKLNDLEVKIQQFLDMPNFKLNKANIGDNKWYSDLYKRFKKVFIPSEDYIEKLYNTKYMNHFYTEEEIKVFRNKWGR